jgi:hypothetical protein
MKWTGKKTGENSMTKSSEILEMDNEKKTTKKLVE